MKKISILFLLFAVIFLVGCGPALQKMGITGINFNIPVTMSGGYGGGWDNTYNRPYGYYYQPRVVIKNLTPYALWVTQDGKNILRMPSGAERPIVIHVPYGVSSQIVITCTAYKLIDQTKDQWELIGATTRQFSFYGNVNNKRVEAWQIRNNNLQRP